MLNDMKNMRGRQEKLIELFNLNRVKKIHVLGEDASSPLNTSTISSIAAVTEEDQDHEQVEEILEDWRGRQLNANQMEEMHSTKGFLKKRTMF